MPEISELLKLGQSRSACRPDQLQMLIDVVGHIKDLPGDIIEIGSYKCGSTIVLAAASGLNSSTKKVFAFDTFSGMPAISEFDTHTNGTFDDITFDEIKAATTPFLNLELVRGLHEKTIPEFGHRPVSLIFMDSDLYESHSLCLKHFWPDVVKGGFVVFHDFLTLNCPGVRKAFDEFFKDSLSSLAFSDYVANMLVIQK
jgi:O-methyltransferase